MIMRILLFSFLLDLLIWFWVNFQYVFFKINTYERRFYNSSLFFYNWVVIIINEQAMFSYLYHQKQSKTIKMQTVVKIIIAFFFSQSLTNHQVDSEIVNSKSSVEKSEIRSEIVIIDCFVSVDEKLAYY